jgi:integrase
MGQRLVNYGRLSEARVARREALDFTVRRKGDVMWEFTTDADHEDPDELRQMMLDALRRDGWDERRVDEFEMEVRYAGDRRLIKTFVTTAR